MAAVDVPSAIVDSFDGCHGRVQWPKGAGGGAIDCGLASYSALRGATIAQSAERPQFVPNRAICSRFGEARGFARTAQRTLSRR